MNIAEKIVAAARHCLQTPFAHQGRLPGVGIDCAGVAIYAIREAGIDVTDYSGYPRLPFDGMLKKMMDEQACLAEVNRNQLQAGDVLLMRISSAPQHVAVYVGNGYMVHAYQNIGRVVEQRLCDDWRGKLVAAYRVMA